MRNRHRLFWGRGVREPSLFRPSCLGSIKEHMNLARANRIFVFTKEPALGHALTSTEGRNHHLVVPESALWLNFKEIGQFVDDACVISRKHLVDNPMVCFTSLEREDVLLTGRLVLAQSPQGVKGVTDSARGD